MGNISGVTKLLWGQYYLVLEYYGTNFCCDTLFRGILCEPFFAMASTFLGGLSILAQIFVDDGTLFRGTRF